MADTNAEPKPEPGWITKLHPRHYPNMSGKMAAIVGFIAGKRYTDPAITELHVTPDNMVLAALEGDCGANDFLGSRADLMRNWQALLKCAGLTDAEYTDASLAFANKVESHGMRGVSFLVVMRAGEA